MPDFIIQWDKFWSLFTTPLFELSGNQISVASLFTAALIFFAFSRIAKILERVVHRTLLDKPLDHGLKGSLERFTRYGITTIGIFITLDTVGVSLSSLAAVGAVLMVGVGFGLQNITQNFISGLIILFERPIKIGDLVEVGGVVGRVQDIRVRSTLIHTRDDIAIVVPNSQFISEQVVNESFSGNKVRVHLKVGVAYGSDVNKVKETLLRIADNEKEVLMEPKPTVIFEDFGDSALAFDLRVWTSKMWTREMVCSNLRFAIDAEFRKEGIEIPFPQRDIHIRSGNL